MKTGVIFTVCLALYICQTAQGLQCYECYYYEYDINTGDSQLDSAIENAVGFTDFGDSSCKYGGTVVTCPSAYGSCYKHYMTYTSTYAGYHYSGKSWSKGCTIGSDDVCVSDTYDFSSLESSLYSLTGYRWSFDADYTICLCGSDLCSPGLRACANISVVIIATLLTYFII